MPQLGAVRGVRRGPDQERVWLRLNSQPLFAPGELSPYAVVLSLEDISSTWRAEQELRDSEERFRLLVEDTSDLVFSTAPDGRFGYLNPTARRLLGVEAGAGNLFELLPPEQRDLVYERLHGRASEPVEGQQLELHLRQPSGRELDLLASVRCITGLGGQQLGMNWIAHDVTNFNLLRERLQQEQKEESILRLAGGLAHDFNNMLVGILGTASLLAETIRPSSQQFELAQQIQGSAQQMADLTHKVLAYARGGRHEPQVVNLNQVVEDAVAMLHGSLPVKVELEVELDPNLWHVEADPGQLSQALLNLLLNACEALPESGGNVRVGTYNAGQRPVVASPLAEGLPARDDIVIEVTDNGCGIPADLLPRVCEPFFTTAEPGRGLGLAAAAGIVSRHGGKLALSSRTGEGTVARIYCRAAWPPRRAVAWAAACWARAATSW